MAEDPQAATAAVAVGGENIVEIRGLHYGVAQRQIFRDLNISIRRGLDTLR